MNYIIITGNLVDDPEKIESADLTKMIMAVNDDYVKKDGERGVNFFTVLAWNELGDACVKHLKKGDKIGVQGRLQNRQYNTDNGTARFITEIIASKVEFLKLKKND